VCAGFEPAGPLQQERCNERGAQQIERVAERQDAGLFLHDLADRDNGVVCSFCVIGEVKVARGKAS
jgi:hypothetical protein